MPSELILCTSQEIAKNPFKFNITNVKVYSFEEVIYHTYYNWKHLIDDIFSNEFITWVVDELSLKFLASQINKIAKIENLSNKIISFVTLINFFEPVEIQSLKDELFKWEIGKEWEKLKDKGDYLVNNNEPLLAIEFYNKALKYVENFKLLNNLGVAYMRLENYSEAEKIFNKAYLMNNKKLQIILNYAEACIYNNNFDVSVNLLKTAKEMDENSSFLQYLLGEMNFVTKNFEYSIKFYKKAYSINKDGLYIYRICDVYLELHQFDKAIEILDLIKNRDKYFYLKLSSVSEANKDIRGAIKYIEEGLKNITSDCELLVALAKYQRMGHKLKDSLTSINLALKLYPENEKVNFEYAKIIKAQGFIKEYQSVLKKILYKLKKFYKDTHNIDFK